jgi:glycosyltransferase involved in cell wall biosynthesis
VAGVITLISPAGTGGWRRNEEALSESLDRLGVEHEIRRVELGRFERLRHPWAVGSLLVATAAARELRRALGEDKPEAVIAVNSTAAMRFPFRRLKSDGIPVAIRIDCPASEQFPGVTHALHRRFERRALRSADLALTMGPLSTAAVKPFTGQVAEVPLGIDPSNPLPPAEPPTVIAYGGQPHFKGLDWIVRAWNELGDGRGEAELVITGVEHDQVAAFLSMAGIEEPAAVRWAGRLPRPEYERLLADATAFVSASRLEGHGIAQLEALAVGVPLVTTPSKGAYEAFPIAADLAPRLAAETDELSDAIAAALAMPGDERTGYARRAAAALAPFSHERATAQLAGALNSLGIQTSARAPAAGRTEAQSED